MSVGLLIDATRCIGCQACAEACKEENHLPPAAEPHLTAYTWTDLLPKCTCEFLLDYEDEDENAEESAGRKKKKPWRYRWPDEVRDEVLARLLKLNAKRAKEEQLVSPSTPTSASTIRPKHSRKPKSTGVTPAQPELLPPAQGDLFG